MVDSLALVSGVLFEVGVKNSRPIAWCVHYQRDPALMFGKGDERCAAGVSYDEVSAVDRLGRIGCALRLPCLKRNHDRDHRQGQPLMLCEHLRWPTLEECEAEQREVEESTAVLVSVLPLISAIRGEHRDEDWQGEAECPAPDCTGTLSLRHSGYNGHVWGKCSEPGCLSWVE